MYLPCIFLIGAVVSYITEKFYGQNRRVLIASFCAIVIAWGAMTGIRGKVWESEYSLWSDVLKDYDKALRLFFKALELKHDYAGAQYAIGDVYEINQDYVNAEKYYNIALSNIIITGSDIHLKTLNNLGVVYMKTNRIKEAGKVFIKLDELIPESGFVHYNIAHALMKLKKNKAAASEYKLALEYGYREPEVYKELLRNLIMAGDLKEAENAYLQYKEPIDKLCISNFLKFSIAKNKKDEVNAKKYYDLYLICMKDEIK
jgi:Tfp pilus assembly protein PilF